MGTDFRFTIVWLSLLQDWTYTFIEFLFLKMSSEGMRVEEQVSNEPYVYGFEETTD